jgi:hypothetical protein
MNKELKILFVIVFFIFVASQLYADDSKDTSRVTYPPTEDYKTYIGGHPFSLTS